MRVLAYADTEAGIPPITTYLLKRSLSCLNTKPSKGFISDMCERIVSVWAWEKPIAHRNSSKSIGSMYSSSMEPMGVSLPSPTTSDRTDPEHAMSHLPSSTNGFKAENAPGQLWISSRKSRHPSKFSLMKVKLSFSNIASADRSPSKMDL